MPRRLPRATILAVGLAVATAVALSGCSSTSTDGSAATTAAPPTTPAPTSTTTPGSDAVLFVAVGGNIDAYDTQPPFHRERVVAAGTAPDGSEPHGQICFYPDGSRRFVVAETRAAAPGVAAGAGWGVYQLTGDDIGTFRVARTGGFSSPSLASTDPPSTYGCAFLSDGRLLTTDVGNAQSGAPTGQLIEWFPPYGSTTVAHCTIATGLGSPRGLAVDPQGAIELAAARAPSAGVWRYSGAFPKTPGACAATPSAAAGGTVVSGVTANLLVPAGPNGLGTPDAVALTADGKGLVVTSAPDGVINRYDLGGTFSDTVLQPKAGEQLGATPRAGGTPLGVAVNADGAVFYADPGLLVGAGGAVAPGDRVGSVRRITFSQGRAQAPQVLNQGLPGPDGLGIFDPSKAAGGSASIA
jgi:hypothetical protein